MTKTADPTKNTFTYNEWVRLQYQISRGEAIMVITWVLFFLTIPIILPITLTDFTYIDLAIIPKLYLISWYLETANILKWFLTLKIQ